MRPDFYRVVTDTARAGSRQKNHKTRLRISGKLYNPEIHDTLPYFEETRRARKMSRFPKNKGDNWGPIKRFLQSRIGELWNYVYSEIRWALPENSRESRRHVAGHLVRDTVTTDCFLGDGGKVCHIPKFGTKGAEEVVGFYVHPVTGRLEYKERPPKLKSVDRFLGNGLKVLDYDKETGMSSSEIESRIVLKVDEISRAEKRNGIWFLVHYRRLTEEERVTRDFYGRVIHTLPPLAQISEKQASKKELKKLGLKNDRPRA